MSDDMIEAVKRLHTSDEVLLLSDFMDWLDQKKEISFSKWFTEDDSLHRVPLDYDRLATEFLQGRNK